MPLFLNRDDDRRLTHGLEHQRALCESALMNDVAALLVRLRERAAANTAAAELLLATGCYGYCVDCHIAIDDERLNAAAFAIRCSTCERTYVTENSSDQEDRTHFHVH